MAAILWHSNKTEPTRSLLTMRWRKPSVEGASLTYPPPDMNYQERQTCTKNWRLWRMQAIRTYCGDFHSRTEAEQAICQLQKLWKGSTFEIEFQGKYQSVYGDPQAGTQ